MKKKIWIPIVCAAVVLAVLFVPIPKGSYDDGGTREWTALTYKIVKWNKLLAEAGGGPDVYRATRIYFGADRGKSIDALWEREAETLEHAFIATILELNGDTATVEPVEGEWVRNSADRFHVHLGDIREAASVGDVIKVTYRGGIMETYPAQVNTVQVTFSKDLRHKHYEGEWLNREAAERYEGPESNHLVITELYADCFFAEYVIPMPYTVKINGRISEKWCVGDQVYVTYDNRYVEQEGDRMEGDLLEIEGSSFEMEPGVAYKPVIYLYPEVATEVSVNLSLAGKLTCTYPAYKDGWRVTAAPDGTLTDGTGQTYSYLYWEGETRGAWDFSRGFCVRGEDTASFLEKALAGLGLTRREANEFIVYWLPLMQENVYNIISFQDTAYTDAAELTVLPAPDTQIRVFMAYKPSEEYVDIEEQVLTAPEREGFTLVEWGGTEVT